MSQPITRISYEDFSADVPGFLDRVAKSGDWLEVLWRDGRVALIRPGRSAADALDREGVSALLEQWRVPTNRLTMPAPTPEQIARRHAALQQAEALGQRLLARRGGAPAPSNAELINQEREARSTELQQR